MGLDEQTALADSRRLLTGWMGSASPRFSRPPKDLSADFIVEYGRHRMIVEVKSTASSAAIGAAIEQVKKATRREGHARPVLAVPYMGELGKRLCAEADVSWFDLSGNADIDAPGLRVLIEGKPNRFVRPGRPSTVFAPKSARIARRLLIEPHRAFRQQELAAATGLDDGFTSRIVRRLEEDHLVTREDGMIRVAAPDRLLDAWGERYDFQKHDIIRGHVSARTGEELLARVAGSLDQRRADHAATGLAAAWVYTQFAAFRLVTFFVAQRPTKALLAEMKFREEPKGANVWLVVPNDAGVFDGATTKGAIRCAHPVQTLLDLQGHPERAQEAATELRARLLTDRRSAVQRGGHRRGLDRLGGGHGGRQRERADGGPDLRVGPDDGNERRHAEAHDHGGEDQRVGLVGVCDLEHERGRDVRVAGARGVLRAETGGG